MPKKAKPPPPVEPGATGEEVLIHKLPGVIHDHVRDNMILTETFAKEDRTLHRLADLQKHATGSDPKHLQYRPNPFNKRNHQYVVGKVLTAEPTEGKEDPNSVYLNDVQRLANIPTDKQILPETSNQEFGWFTKVQPLCSFRKDPRVNHPRRYTGITQYMDTFWSYYPPREPKFHPRDK